MWESEQSKKKPNKVNSVQSYIAEDCRVDIFSGWLTWITQAVHIVRAEDRAVSRLATDWTELVRTPSAF